MVRGMIEHRNRGNKKFGHETLLVVIVVRLSLSRLTTVHLYRPDIHSWPGENLCAHANAV